MKRYLLHTFYYDRRGNRVIYKGAFDDLNEAKKEALDIQLRFFEIAKRFELHLDRNFSPVCIDDTKKAILYELQYDGPDAYGFGEVEIPTFARYWEKK